MTEGAGPSPEASERLGADGLRRRATGGAVVLAARGTLILTLGVGANIVLARLLSPRDFGLFALGSVVLVFGGYLAQGGLGAGLIRREADPTRRELAAVNAVQLAATAAIALVVALAAWPFGPDGLVVAALAALLPVTILRAPSVIILERRLSFRAIATVDVAEAVAFYAWALSAVAVGFGVWGLVTGMAVRAVVGTALMIRLGPIGLVRPRWSWPHVRPLVAFGARLQAVALVGVVRDQGLNVACAAIAGVAALGTWNLAFRVLQVPSMLFSAANQVVYPAMSQMLVAGGDARPTIERGIATLTVAGSLVLVAIVGFAPAFPAVIGEAWRQVPATLAWSCLALIVGAPLQVMAIGYLFAAGAAGMVLRAMVAYAGVWLGVALPLLPTLGVPAIGLGWIAGSVVNAVVLSRYLSRRTGASVASSLLPPAGAAVLAGALAWSVATAGDETLLRSALAAALGEATLLGGLAVVRRTLVRDAYGLLVEAIRESIGSKPYAGSRRPPERIT